MYVLIPLVKYDLFLNILWFGFTETIFINTFHVRIKGESFGTVQVAYFEKLHCGTGLGVASDNFGQVTHLCVEK